MHDEWWAPSSIIFSNVKHTLWGTLPAFSGTYLYFSTYSHSFKVMIGVASITHSFRLKTEPTKHVLFIVCALDVGNLLDVHLAAVKSGHVQPIQIRRPSCALRSYHLPRSVLLSYINPHHNIQSLSRAWSGKNEVRPLTPPIFPISSPCHVATTSSHDVSNTLNKKNHTTASSTPTKPAAALSIVIEVLERVERSQRIWIPNYYG